MAQEEVDMSVRDDAEAIAPELAGLRRAIHREPEIGFELPRTQHKVLAALEEAASRLRGDGKS